MLLPFHNVIRKALIVAVFFALTAPVASAEVLEELYLARVSVSDQSAEQRAGRLPVALDQVLVRIGGTQAVGLAALVEDPATLMRRYQYRSGGDDRLTLEVEFDERAVDRLLRDHGQTVWGRERPRTLVWLAVRDGADRRVVGRGDGGAAGRAIERASRSRGVPVRLPMWDRQDQSVVEFVDLWGGFFESVERASERYDADVFLIGRVERDSRGSYLSRWTLIENGQRQSWERAAASLDGAVEGGVAELADMQISRLGTAVGTMDRATARIVVDGVHGLRDYARVLSYLEGLSPVSGVYVTRAHAARLELNVLVQGTPQRLDDVIRVGSVLDPTPTTAHAFDAERLDGGRPHFIYAFGGG